MDKLPLYCPDEQMIFFDEGEAENALDRGPPRTKLTAYFELNRECPQEMRDILYSDVPSHFTWDQKNKKWKARQRGYSIGRVPTVSLIKSSSNGKILLESLATQQSRCGQF